MKQSFLRPRWEAVRSVCGEMANSGPENPARGLPDGGSRAAWLFGAGRPGRTERRAGEAPGRCQGGAVLREHLALRPRGRRRRAGERAWMASVKQPLPGWQRPCFYGERDGEN